ncbi:MAG TPA: hypothetical protein VLE46_13950, partial [Nitrospira sp.]|nr:hypothetical protein [Nitrospira sp.]
PSRYSDRGIRRLIIRKGRLSYNRAEASVRGTAKRIEAERWGGEQARRYQAGSLNPSKASILLRTALLTRLRSSASQATAESSRRAAGLHPI